MNGGNARFQGGTIRNATFSGSIGQLNFAPGFTLESATFYNNTANASDAILNSVTASTGATLNISGGQADNLLASGGTINISGGATAGTLKVLQTGASMTIANATVDHLYVSNAAQGVICRLYDGAVVKNVVASGWKTGYTELEAMGGAVMSNVELQAGDIWFYGANNKAYGVVEKAGEFIVQSAGGYASDFTLSGGHLYVRNGGVAENVSAVGNGVLHIDANGGMVSGAFISGNAGVSHLVHNGTLADFTLAKTVISGGSLCLLSGGVIDGGEIRLRYESGGALMRDITIVNNSAIVDYEGNSGTNVKVSGGRLYFQRGGYGSGITVYSGGHFQINNASGADITMSGGYFIMNAAAQYTFGSASNVKIYSGTAEIIRADVSDLEIRKDAKVYGNAATFTNFNIEAPDEVSAGLLNISNGTVASGGRINGKNTITVVYMTGGAKLNEAYVSGGSVFLSANAEITNLELTGGAVILRGSDTYGSKATVLGGAYYFQNGAKGDDITVAGGTLVVHDTNMTNPAGSSEVVNDVTMTAGRVEVSSGGTINGLNASGGVVYVFSSGTLNSVTVGNKATLNVSGGTANSTTVNLQGGMYVYSGGTANSTTVNAMGGMHVSGGVANSTLVNSYGNMHVRSGGTVNEATVNSSGTLYVSSGVANSTTVNSRGNMNISSGGVANAITVNSGNLYVFESGVANSTTANGGNLYLFSGGTINGLSATGGVVNAFSGGTINANENDRLNNLQAYEGATIHFTCNKSVANFTGSDTNVAEGTLYYSFAGSAGKEDPLDITALSGHIENGVFKDFNADGSDIRYKLSIGEGIVLDGGILNHDKARVSAFEGAVVSGMTLRGGAIICVNGANVRILDTTLTGEAGTCNLNLSAGAYASNTTVGSGGRIQFQNAAAKADNTTIKAGGSMVMTSAADTGDLVTLDFTGTTGNQSVYITNFANVKSSTRIVLKGEQVGATYTLTTGAATADKVVYCDEWGIYDDAVRGGTTYTNAFTGLTYDFSTGKSITVSTFTAATQSEAGSIEGGTTINGNGKAAKWDSATTATGTIEAATSGISGDAWLELDGANLAGTTLFGAETGFGGVVNLYATGDAVVNNLAAGAEAGGTVAGVKLTVDSATVGLAYAGGFGTVTGATETLIGTGATMQKDFYAGALANYAKTNTVTSAGDVALTIEAGTFSGNIYGAASVKAGAATSLVHNVGNVTINVTGGSTTKGNQACLFAGGYATGSTINKVYTVGTVDTTISGGSWGTVAGGRGIFGGIFASNVTAEAGNVSVTVNGGSFGNVYGGGWAQQGGNSVVGDVNLTITGGTIANVFGGGSTSSSGGATYADDVTITVSGGSITGAIYARGQLATDHVTGTATVKFTGGSDFGCEVYGYSYVGSETNDATLTFNGYTGTFSGEVGGFSSITFDGNTAMTLSTAAADVNNGKWEFDFTGRADTLAGTSLLTWENADFAGDTVKVAFTDAAQAAAGWSIATAAFDATTTFDLYIGGTEIASVAYNTAIADGDWAGWKFTSVDGTLKFAQITA